jgi:hypothetical protein
MLELGDIEHIESIINERFPLRNCGSWERIKSKLKEIPKTKDKTFQKKRPINVDLDCRIRVVGHANYSFKFISDEGGGYEIYPGYAPGKGPDLKPHHFEEWAEQLRYVAEWCTKKAEELKAIE